jgi:8-oxo-dGTP diphosphatase
MTSGDGNGWVTCRLGHRHWGRFGAAGLVLVRATPGGDASHDGDGSPEPQVLLQLRAGWTHEGGTWGVPGGARDSHESVETAALREAGEEAGVDANRVRMLDGDAGRRVGADHGNWSYTYVLALAPADLPIGPPTMESEALAWVDLAQVAALPLHSGLATAWPQVHGWIGAAVS